MIYTAAATEAGCLFQSNVRNLWISGEVHISWVSSLPSAHATGLCEARYPVVEGFQCQSLAGEHVRPRGPVSVCSESEAARSLLPRTASRLPAALLVSPSRGVWQKGSQGRSDALGLRETEIHT